MRAAGCWGVALLVIAASWALVLGWLLSPWLELAAGLFWTGAYFYALERGGRRR